MAEYMDVILTDMRLHAQKPTHPKSADRVIQKAKKSKKAQRFYRPLPKNIDSKAGSFEFTLLSEKELLALEEMAHKQGKKLRINVPKEGMNVYLSEDALERIKAFKKRHPLTL